MKLKVLLPVLSLFLILTSCGKTNEVIEIPEEEISKAVLEQNRGMYKEGETVCEGHITLLTEGNDKKAEAYVLTTYGEYGFENGNFEKVSGSGVIPTKITFAKNKEGYSVKYYEVPADGSEYADSVKKLFPKTLHKRALLTSQLDYEECKKQEFKMAEEYLKGIGRTAKIGEYGDFEHISFEDAGMSAKAVNRYIENQKSYNLSDYPDYIGTREKVEDGVRYSYIAYVNESEKVIELKKVKTNSELSLLYESYAINMSTGEVRKHV